MWMTDEFTPFLFTTSLISIYTLLHSPPPAKLSFLERELET